ncbi:MAG: hypothetical protein FWD11_05795 [Micrococcales bacterium]|nr:hypothetical protein [Micrococcales bacterium]
MRRHAFSFVLAAAVAVVLAGCSGSDSPPQSGPTGGSGGPGGEDGPTSTVVPVDPPATTQAPQATTECRVFPNENELCATGWGAPLVPDPQGGWSDWLTLTFTAGGTVAWTHSASETEGTGTWSSDGTTVWVHLDKAPSAAGSGDLVLTLGTKRRGCGDPPVMFTEDTLVSQQPSLQFEPVVC